MKVGVGLPNTTLGLNRDLILNWARQADEGPFSSLGVFDRLVYASYEPLTTLAAAAAVTTRIGLATTIVIGPLRNTATLAKTAATVDALSEGRLTLGLAVGARKEDYDAANVNYRLRGKVLAEQLITLRSHWEDETIGPQPAQPNGPPLIIGGGSDIVFARVARYADGYIHGGGPPRAFARVADKARAAWTDAGRPGKPQLWAQGYYALGDAATIETGHNYLRDYYAFTGPFAERIAEGMLTTRQAIAQFVGGYRAAGCDELILYPAVSDPGQLDQLAKVINEI
jgi:alkanesulfonate monooxygenase SsuD/methylene tetrahydromethanopterin reductase-like flavin-dependent oxidoreductase (luciferase family)